MKKLLATIALTAMTALTACSGEVNEDASPTMIPCEFEDSPGPCFWDASLRGNGEGRSFWVDDQQRVHYTNQPGPAWDPFRDIEGHHDCWIRIGNTSEVRCAGGFTTTS